MDITVLPYSWFELEENEKYSILIWCYNQENKLTLIRIEDWEPYFHYQIKDIDNISKELASEIATYISKIIKNDVSYDIERKRELYTAEGIERDLLKLSFKTINNMQHCINYINKVGFITIGSKKCNVIPIEYYMPGKGKTISQIDKLIKEINITHSCWIDINNIIEIEEKISDCDKEYIISWKNIKKSNYEGISYPSWLFFDIETYSNKINTKPKANKPKDVIFMNAISYAEWINNKYEEKTIIQIIKGICKKIEIENVEIKMYDNELELIDDFCLIIKKFRPAIISGFNIFGYDLKYIDARYKGMYLKDTWLNISKLKNFNGCIFIPEEYKNSGTYAPIDVSRIINPGTIYIDIFTFVRRNANLRANSLNETLKYYLDEEKVDFNYKLLFMVYMITQNIDWKKDKNKEQLNKLYKKLIKKTNKLLKTNYDSDAKFRKLNEEEKINIAESVMTMACNYNKGDVSRLLRITEKTNLFVWQMEESNIMKVSIQDVHTRLQGIKVFAFLYNFMHKCKVYFNEANIEKVKVKGGNVYEVNEVIGLHDDVVVLDFAGLYPSIMRAYNIDYTTLVTDDTVNNDKCYIFEWEDEYGKHKTRWLKENIRRGILPMILDDLAIERKKMKNIAKKYADEGNNTMNIIYDKRQNAIKVLMNSAYGLISRGEGGTPLSAGGATVTYIGRREQKNCEEFFKEKGGKTIYGDSVTGDTPILIKINGKIEFITIEVLYSVNKLQEKLSLDNKKYKIPENIEVWSDNGFTKIKYIMKHKYQRKLYRILTDTGVIDVTEDHSLLDKEGNKIKPCDINIGDELMHNDLPIINKKYFPTDLAYAYGFFFAEGSCRIYNCNYGKKCIWTCSNQDISILEKVGNILTKYEKNNTFIILDTMKSSNTYKLSVFGKVKKLVEKWRKMFYDKDKNKIIPQCILKSCLDAKKSFLEGYYENNGINNFACKGKIGSAGLSYLCHCIDKKISINIDMYQPNIFYMSDCKTYGRNANIVKEIIDITQLEKYQNCYVYDLETENHHFSAGIGKLVISNTDSIMTKFPNINRKEIFEKMKEYLPEINSKFKYPMSLEMEKILRKMLLLTPKVYCYIKMDEKNRDEILFKNFEKKGVTFKDANACIFIQEVYNEVVKKFILGEKREDIENFIKNEAKKIKRDEIPLEELSMIIGYTGKNYKNNCKQKQFFNRLIEEGEQLIKGTKYEYYYVKVDNKKAKVGDMCYTAEQIKKYDLELNRSRYIDVLYHKCNTLIDKIFPDI